MDAIVKMLEKHQPFFEKISRNIYLQAIKDGFLGCMPIVLTSSIFLLIATLPGVVGVTLPQPLIDWCNKLYNFTMGVMGIMVAGTTAKNFTASMNRRMPAGKVLNDGSTMVAAQCSMLLLAVTQFTTKFNGSELSVFDCTSMGTRGLFSAYIAAFITVWVYKFCVSRDLTIKLPKEVPGAIAQNFRDIIPFGGAVIICGIIDVVVRNLMGVPFSELLIKLLSPLFTAAETYPGLILIQAATAFFWFIGVHGPSIVQPGIDPIRLANQAENLQVLLAGGHPAHSLTFNMSLVGEFGGTGATFIVPLLLILFMKSKQLKAVGKASIVPVAFAVNEPLLFGAPMILNPYMLIPFVAAGCANVGIITGDGTPMILSYNTKCEALDPVKTYTWSTEDNKPVTNATSNCVASVFEINGKKKPNKQNEDVALFNANGLGSSCAIELESGRCFGSPFTPTPLTKAECEALKGNSGVEVCRYDNDYWAGAVKQCGGVGNLPTMSDLGKIAGAIYEGNPQIGADQTGFNLTYVSGTASSLGLPEPQFYLWSGEEDDSGSVNWRIYDPVYTGTGNTLNRGKAGWIQAVCLTD